MLQPGTRKLCLDNKVTDSKYFLSVVTTLLWYYRVKVFIHSMQTKGHGQIWPRLGVGHSLPTPARLSLRTFDFWEDFATILSNQVILQLQKSGFIK